MFNSKSFNTLNSLHLNFGQLFENFDDFREEFMQMTSQKFVAMLYFADVDNFDDNYLAFKAPDMTGVKAKLKY